MANLVLFPVLLAAGCLIAGIYGALHNQISYTVSLDYFFVFKFYQFEIPEHLQNRIGASIVGWYASWWMGVIIGVPVLLIGLIMPDWRTYLKHCLVAIAAIALTTLAIGLGALIYAYFAISQTQLPDFWYPDGVRDRVAFARAGTMHNFSYLGGAIGIVTGSVYLILARLRLNKHTA